MRIAEPSKLRQTCSERRRKKSRIRCGKSDVTSITEYFRTDDTARLKLMNVAKNNSSSMFDELKAYVDSGVRKELKEKIDFEKTQEFNSYNFASKCNCAEIYDSMYRITSASVHSTPRALIPYVNADDSGTVLAINWRPPATDVPQRVYEITRFLIMVYSGIAEVFGNFKKQDVDARLHNLELAKKTND